MDALEQLSAKANVERPEHRKAVVTGIIYNVQLKFETKAFQFWFSGMS